MGHHSSFMATVRIEYICLFYLFFSFIEYLLDINPDGSVKKYIFLSSDSYFGTLHIQTVVD